MKKSMNNAKLALLSCPFELPKLKTCSLIITDAQEFKKLEEYERNKFKEMIKVLKESKVDVVICQWGFDDEANSLLMENNLPALRWVGGHDLGLLAVHTSASIIARFKARKSWNRRY